MTDLLRVFLGIAVVLYFVIIMYFLKKKTLLLKYTLLWLFSGFAMGILVLCPQLLEWFVSMVDIKTPMNGLFAVCILAILIILMSLTAIVSKQNEKIKHLVQYMAILEKKERELRERTEVESE